MSTARPGAMRAAAEPAVDDDPTAALPGTDAPGPSGRATRATRAAAETPGREAGKTSRAGAVTLAMGTDVMAPATTTSGVAVVTSATGGAAPATTISRAAVVTSVVHLTVTDAPAGGTTIGVRTRVSVRGRRVPMQAVGGMTRDSVQAQPAGATGGPRTAAHSRATTAVTPRADGVRRRDVLAVPAGNAVATARTGVVLEIGTGPPTASGVRIGAGRPTGIGARTSHRNRCRPAWSRVRMSRPHRPRRTWICCRAA